MNEEAQLNATHFSGEACGWAGAAALLRAEAATAFLNGTEALARRLKSLATACDEQEREARTQQKNEELMEDRA